MRRRSYVERNVSSLSNRGSLSRSLTFQCKSFDRSSRRRRPRVCLRLLWLPPASSKPPRRIVLRQQLWGWTAKLISTRTRGSSEVNGLCFRVPHISTQGNYHRLSLLSSSDEAEAEAAAGGAVTTAKVHHHYHGPSLQVVSRSRKTDASGSDDH